MGVREASSIRGPSREQKSDEKEDKEIGIKVGVSEMRGWRRSMEDAHLISINFDKKGSSLFGVFDGHGGPLISKFVASNLEKVLINLNDYKKGNYEQALIKSFLLFDEYLRNKRINKFILDSYIYSDKTKKGNEEQKREENKGFNPEEEVYLNFNGRYFYGKSEDNINPNEFKRNGDINGNGNENTEDENNENNIGSERARNYRNHLVADEMGTTANVILIKNEFLYVANVGDSRSVMYQNKKAVKLNIGHKPELKDEEERIKNSNTDIINRRIKGKLNLSRAIGDLEFKTNKYLKTYEQSVTSYPEIRKIKRKNIEFIVMGWDGIMDCYAQRKQYENTLCNDISKKIKEKEGLGSIIVKLLEKNLSPTNGQALGTDNMTCIIIQFLNKIDPENE